MRRVCPGTAEHSDLLDIVAGIRSRTPKTITMDGIVYNIKRKDGVISFTTSSVSGYDFDFGSMEIRDMFGYYIPELRDHYGW